MAAAASGKARLPPVKTFGANPYSTNTVQKDLQAAEDWRYVAPNTDIADLTWEQKGMTPFFRRVQTSVQHLTP